MKKVEEKYTEEVINKIYGKGLDELGWISMDRDKDIVPMEWVDQDRHPHLVFTKKNKEDFMREKLHVFYNTVFRTGNTCLSRSHLYNAKKSFNGRGKEDDKVTIITLASIYLTYNLLRRDFVDMDLMSKMLAWLYE